jgi:hypothetical protein
MLGRIIVKAFTWLKRYTKGTPLMKLKKGDRRPTRALTLLCQGHGHDVSWRAGGAERTGRDVLRGGSTFCCWWNNAQNILNGDMLSLPAYVQVRWSASNPRPRSRSGNLLCMHSLAYIRMPLHPLHSHIHNQILQFRRSLPPPSLFCCVLHSQLHCVHGTGESSPLEPQLLLKILLRIGGR